MKKDQSYEYLLLIGLCVIWVIYGKWMNKSLVVASQFIWYFTDSYKLSKITLWHRCSSTT